MRTHLLLCSMMCRLWFKYWPGSVISIISFGHMGFLLPGAIINPYFITTNSCIFHFHSVHLPHFTHFWLLLLFWTPHLKFCLSLPTEHYFWQFPCPDLSCLHTPHSPSIHIHLCFKSLLPDISFVLISSQGILAISSHIWPTRSSLTTGSRAASGQSVGCL